MDPFDLHPAEKDTRAAFRRQVWLQLYLPLALGITVLAAAVAFLWRSQVGGASVWADVSLSLLLAVGLVLGLLVLAALATATIGVSYLIRELPEPFRQARLSVARAERSTERAAGRAMLPVIVPQAVWHSILSTLDYLAGIFRRPAA